ncbi:MAG: hypothetical protein ACM31L_11700 [Actinomycetota bacterium]
MAPGRRDIDFSNIRAVHGDRKHGFEELVCQLGRLDPPAPDARYFRGDGAGGDGGVEAYWTLADGRKVAYQAKYHLRSGDIDWDKVDGSVRTAMGVHPTIYRYVIAFPCNLTPRTARSGARGRPQKSGEEHWDECVAEWKAAFPEVEFMRWDESELLRRLILPEPAYVGIRAWFFHLPHWTEEWFRQRFERAAVDLGERYHADEHVHVAATDAFEGLVRSPVLQSRLAAALRKARGISQGDLVVMEVCPPPEPGPTLQEITARPAFLAAVDAVIGLSALETDFPKTIGEVLPLVGWQALAEQTAQLIAAFVAEHGRSRSDTVMQIDETLRDAVAPVAALLRSPLFQAEHRRAVLLVGEFGIGKSHLLAEVADRATRAGHPVILVPGQWLDGAAEPWGQIRSRLDVDRFSTDEVLGALDAWAEAAGTRALILVDALNESRNADRWRDHLGSFIRDILAFPRLAVAVSCRSDYLDWVVPDPLPSTFIRVECRGFVTEEEQEQAAEMFLDRKGIARPAMPWLAPDFTNPLFLRVTAAGLAAAGQRTFPQFIGLAEFFAFFVRSLSVRHPFDRWSDSTLLPLCLRAIAREMLRVGRPWLSQAQAAGAIRGVLAEYDGDDSPARAGALLRDLQRGALLPLPDPEAPRPASNLTPMPDGVIFVFQRLGELLMAEEVVDALSAASFKESGDLAFVGRDPDAWAGLLGALAILLPQRRGVELLDVANLRLNSATAHRKFRDSLLWRTANAFLPATERWFDHLYEDYQIEVLIRLSSVPNHPWNADRLDRRLRGLAMPERDLVWSIPLALADYNAEEAIDQIIAWSLGTHCHLATDETLRLTATVLAWMLTTSDRNIRDRATKALAHIFLLRPTVMTVILDRFHRVDDPYLAERLWAAAYGAAMNAAGDWALAALAQQTWTLCFATGQPPVSLRTRDHAQGIIELVDARGVLPPGILLDRCRPPFVTDWPLEEVGDEVIEAARVSGAGEVVGSVTGLGDFSRYVLESCLNRWSSVPLGEPTPTTGDQRYEGFVAEIVDAGSIEVKTAWEGYQKALSTRWQRLVPTFVEVGDEASPGEADEPDPVDVTLAAFLALLPPDVAAEAAERIDGRGHGIPKYDAKRAERWLIKRVLDLGWTADRFAAFEAALRIYDRERPKTERIGKKYQWIALDELLARLSDNVHHIGRWPERVVSYRTSADQPFFRDCDPSVLTVPSHPDGPAWWRPAEAMLAPCAPEAMTAWVGSEEDVPLTPALFDLQDPGRRQWLLLYGMTKRADGASTRHRESWSRVTTVLVRKADREGVIAALADKHISDPSGHQPADFTDDGYLGEFLWRSSWPVEAMGTETDRGGLCDGLPVVWPVIGYHWEGHIDLSVGSVALKLPSGWLCGQMGLSAKPGCPGAFVDVDGKTVFMDPAAFTDHSAVAVIDRQRFLAFLDSSGWDCLWLVGGEKNLWPGGLGHGIPDRWACRYHSAVYWWENGAWQSRSWSDFNCGGI